MADYIDRKALLHTIERMSGMGGMAVLCHEDVIETIEKAPAADVVEVVHARWETIPGTKNRKHCTNCDFSGPEYIKFYDYCPNCGARMDGDA